MFHKILVFIATLLLALGQLLAQSATGSISGVVIDNSGAAVARAEVKVTNTSTNVARTSFSGDDGSFSLTFLPLGTYRVEVSAHGFKKFEQTGVVLEIDRNARLSPVLELGTLTETVTVNADAPLVNTLDASIGRMVTNNEIINLPLVNRNVYSLLNLTAGVESSTSSNSLGVPEQVTLVNGSSYGGAGSVNYFLDGGSNVSGFKGTGNLAPNPDAVQEFRVVTNSFSSEYGRFAGGVVEVITKSGTNQYHGSAFEFLRNDKLNAYMWGALTKAPLRRNQFGGSFGGPLIKDKTFIFGSYSGLRQMQSVFKNTAVVPTALERAGNFSASRVKPRDPLTNQPFPNDMIPLNRFDPVAKRILDNYIPLANSPGSIFQAQAPTPQNNNEYQLKVDHTLSAKHQLTGSYFTNRGSNTEALAGNLPWSTRSFVWAQQNYNASDTWLVSPSTVNQFRVTYLRDIGGRVNSPDMSLGDLGSTFNIQGTKSLPQITVNGVFTLGQAIAGNVFGTNYYGIREILSRTMNKHSVKIGGEFSLEKSVSESTLNNYGTFSFQGNKTGSALADFLLGLPQTMNQDAPINKSESTWYTGLFFQDDIRLHPRFTLNLGLRYDLQTPYTDPHDRKLTYVAGAQSRVSPKALPGLLFPGDPGISRGLVHMDKNNISPRLGFAWDPTGKGKMSVRAAFGVFYGAVSGQAIDSSTNGNPFSIRQQFNNVATLANPYANLPGGLSPFPFTYNPANPTFTSPSAVSGTSLDFRWPYTYQMNVSVQRQITQNVSLSAAYVGSLGRRLPFTRDLNYPIYTGAATSANVDLRRPILPGQFAAISMVESIMNTAYHGLQFTGEKRLRHGISLKGFYTYSKSLEDARLQNDTTAGGAEDMRNLRLERGRTDNDRRHNFVMSVIWQLNYVQHANPVLKSICNGWTVSAITSARSGTPLTITAGTDVNLDGTNNDRANLVGNPVLDPNRSRSQVTAMWFNTAAFVKPATGQDGNAGRNIIDDPGVKNVDLGLFREFRFTERMQLQFRAEMTNAFNLVNLGDPTTNFSSALFGQIQSARPMRETQLGLRLIF